MRNSSSSVTLVLIILASISISSSFTYAAVNPNSIHHTTVVLTNKFPTDSTIRCKSKTDDRGVRKVGSGQTYSFDITFESAELYMFFCEILTSGGTAVLDIYDSSRDIVRCPGKCNWDVAANGVSGYKEGSTTPDIVFKW